MKYDIVYLSDAQNDIQNAKKWYKSKQIGLEKRFAIEVKNAILLIGNDPHLFEVRYRNTRIVFTKIFPFGIHYTIDKTQNRVVILAVLHTSKDSNNW
ncbi:type II toxin-antitoxin system RelE/ParE family toxin [Chryseobacterium sp.]|uniref:type II toxin-antitoxin system RelE/ParE family toxin n=1 Tax=Chryseobacterium sp. TaxID=1871047 RepID=UPI00388E3316